MLDKAQWDRDQTLTVKFGENLQRSEAVLVLSGADPGGITKVRHAPSGYPDLLDEALQERFRALDREFLKNGVEEYRDDRRCIALADEIQATGIYPPAEQRWHVASFNTNAPSSELLGRNARFIGILTRLKTGDLPAGLAETVSPPSAQSISRQLAIALFNQATQLYEAGELWAAIEHARLALLEDDGSSPAMSTRRRLSLAGMLAELTQSTIAEARSSGLSDTEYQGCFDEALEEYKALGASRK